MAAAPPPSRKQLREFGLLIGIVFPVVFGWLGPNLRSHPAPAWPFVLGIPFLVLGLAWPAALAWPYRGWMALGHGLGWVNSHLVLGLVFVLAVQPVALIRRLFGYDPLRRRFEDKASYREPHAPGSIDLKRIF
jgi:hypothetical protein